MSLLLLSVLALAVPILLGYFVTRMFWPSHLSPRLPWIFAPCIGAGLCSIIFIAFRRPMLTVESFLLVVLAVSWFMSRRSNPTAMTPVMRGNVPLSFVLLACAAGMALSMMMVRIDRTPHGDWDATAIWNSHARYLYRDGPEWQQNIQNTFHADYPLLVPSMAARLYRYLNQEIPDAAGFLGIVFTFSAISIMVAMLAELRGVRLAVLFTLVLLGTPFFLEYGVSQSADVPLSLFILSTVALICLHSLKAPGNAGLIVLAGFTAGCAGWTKNEGLLFIVITATAVLLSAAVHRRQPLRTFAAFLVGLALPLAVVFWFKLAVAPPTDILENRQYAEVMEKILNVDRYATILTTGSQIVWSFGAWLVNPFVLVALYVGLRGVDRNILRDPGWRQSIYIVAGVMAGYATVYLITPIDLPLHMDSSLPRLCLHLWPTVLFLAGLVTKDAPILRTQTSQRTA
jgi:hypothetical protein